MKITNNKVEKVKIFLHIFDDFEATQGLCHVTTSGTTIFMLAEFFSLYEYYF